MELPLLASSNNNEQQQAKCVQLPKNWAAVVWIQPNMTIPLVCARNGHILPMCTELRPAPTLVKPAYIDKGLNITERKAQS